MGRLLTVVSTPGATHATTTVLCLRNPPLLASRRTTCGGATLAELVHQLPLHARSIPLAARAGPAESVITHSYDYRRVPRCSAAVRDEPATAVALRAGRWLHLSARGSPTSRRRRRPERDEVNGVNHDDLWRAIYSRSSAACSCSPSAARSRARLLAECRVSGCSSPRTRRRRARVSS
jgi:hypothetical protein